MDDRSSNNSELARFIRRLARWGPWACIGIAALIVAGTFLAVDRDVTPAVAIGGMITPVILNVFAALMIRALRPLMYANADRLEQLD